jgi:hypothetical protein
MEECQSQTQVGFTLCAKVASPKFYMHEMSPKTMHIVIPKCISSLCPLCTLQLQNVHMSPKYSVPETKLHENTQLARIFHALRLLPRPLAL